MDAAPQILLIEDDPRLAELLIEYLSSEGYEMSHQATGSGAADRVLTEQPDLLILDLMLPVVDGLSICRTLRPEYQGAILMLTARGEDMDEVLGLEVGADDYLAKPARPQVLAARIKSLLRRQQRMSSANADARKELHFGALSISLESRLVTLRGETIELTTAEFDLLTYLASRAGEVVHREVIYRELKGVEYDGIDRSIDLRVARLRKKLGDDAKHPTLIKSIRSVGYLMAKIS